MRNKLLSDPVFEITTSDRQQRLLFVPKQSLKRCTILPDMVRGDSLVSLADVTCLLYYVVHLQRMLLDLPLEDRNAKKHGTMEREAASNVQ